MTVVAHVVIVVAVAVVIVDVPVLVCAMSKLRLLLLFFVISCVVSGSRGILLIHLWFIHSFVCVLSSW